MSLPIARQARACGTDRETPHRAGGTYIGDWRGTLCSHRHRESLHFGWSDSQFAAYSWARTIQANGAISSSGRCSTHELGEDWRQKTSTRAVIFEPFAAQAAARIVPPYCA